jgi:triosephosphate isomerase
MRSKIVAGNWKMHGSKTMVQELLSDLLDGLEADYCEAIVLPPAIYLGQTQSLLANTQLSYGAQNVAAAEQGAYTGEISAPMLQEFGCKYTLIGHSERRKYYSETNESVADKVILAHKHNIKPIICMGETLEERQAEQTFEIIKNQLTFILMLDNWRDLLQNAILAYEPVWAIGTGCTADPEQAQEVHEFIRNIIADKDVGVAMKLPILYGGSVKPDNAEGLFAKADIDGALVGGASLKAQDFLGIIRCNS